MVGDVTHNGTLVLHRMKTDDRGAGLLVREMAVNGLANHPAEFFHGLGLGENGLAQRPGCVTALKIRSRRIYACWAAGLVFLAALGAFCWLVVRPVLAARAVIADVYGRHRARQAGWDSFDPCVPDGEVGAAVERLGGSGRTLQLLRIHLHLPESTAPHKILAVQMLGRCGKAAIPTLVSFVEHEGPVENDDLDAAVVTLGDFGPEARAAEPVLTKLRGETMNVGLLERIDEALKKIRAEKSPSPPGNQTPSR